MSILAAILVLYLAAGIVIGIAFVLFGVTRTLPYSVTVTAGARILFLPGSVLLWPFVLGRWLKSRNYR